MAIRSSTRHAAARPMRAVCILSGLFLAIALCHAAGPSPAAPANPAPASQTSHPAPANPAGQVRPPVTPSGPAHIPKAPVKQISKPLWTELSPMQQQVLAPLAAEWGSLDAIHKVKWLELANRYPKMKPEEQQRIQARMREWAKLTPEQRRLARENYARAKKLNPDQKSAEWRQYQQLPEEQKKKLAAAADAEKKKQVANLPPSIAEKPKAVAPVKLPEPVPVPPPAVAPPPPAADPSSVQTDPTSGPNPYR